MSNPKHEHFAQLIAEEKLCDLDAYTEAGFKRHRSSASRLRNDANIRARVQELKERASKRHDVTIESVLKELEEARLIARKCEQGSAMVSATKAKAQLMGLWVERSENLNQNHNYVVSDSPEEQSAEEWLDQHKPT
ncbi:MAG: hypothetical protein N4A65_00395 [Cohaesibacter sp.]|nr:hypothetical protein [Cohaesibacter sp.]